MKLQDLLATLQIRLRYGDLAIKAPPAQKSRIEDLGCRRSHNDDAFGTIKAVHFREELIQRLFTFFISEQAGAPDSTRSADRIEFVDEDDARRTQFGLFKEVPYTRCSNANEHLDKT